MISRGRVQRTTSIAASRRTILTGEELYEEGTTDALLLEGGLSKFILEAPFTPPGPLVHETLFTDYASVFWGNGGTGIWSPYKSYYDNGARSSAGVLTLVVDKDYATAPLDPFTFVPAAGGTPAYMRMITDVMPEPYKTNTGGYPYYAGGLFSSYGPHWDRYPPAGQGFEKKYGYFEARVRTPAQQGYWAAWWLDGGFNGIENIAGEIDIFEHLGSRPTLSIQTIHNKSGDPDFVGQGGQNAQGTTHIHECGFDWSVDFHDYGLLWTPDNIVFYVDGKPTRSVSPGMAALYRERVAPMFMELGVGIVNSDTIWPYYGLRTPNGTDVLFVSDYFDVMRVRVYDLDGV